MLDFHNHLMPGVDDGAADLSESRNGLAEMLGQGVTTIITTPHIRGSQTHRPEDLYKYLSALDAAFADLQAVAASEFPTLRIERGVELMLDVPSPMLIDDRMHLAGTKFVLVEFPFMNIPPNSTVPLREMRAGGVIPVIAHPERYANLSLDFDIVDSWRDAGAFIQVNCGSLIGSYGQSAQRQAWRILRRGWADYLSSDYHSRGRCAVKQCAEEMKRRGAEAQHRALTITNPGRLIHSENPLPVMPVEEKPRKFWQKVFR